MLIFLDIDGVMLPAKGWKAPELLDDGFPAFGSKAVCILQEFISEDTVVMLTTSHKSRFPLEKWKSIFMARGIHIHSIDSLPENVENLSRKDEIINWFDANKANAGFIIIDDDKSLNDLPKSLKDNLVLTSSLVGLTDEHREEIIEIINRKAELV